MQNQTRLFYLTGALLLIAGQHRNPSLAQATAPLQPQHYYVADAFKNQLLQMDDETGKNTVLLGEKGSGVRQFDHPARLFVDDKGCIYVCDTDNHRIVRMDDITGKGWTEIGSRGQGEKQFQFPVSVQVEPNGRLTVLDLGNTRIVQMNDIRGANWRTLSIPGVSERLSDPRQAQRNEALSHLGEAHLPNVAVDAPGRLYYPDQERSVVTRLATSRAKTRSCSAHPAQGIYAKARSTGLR